MIKNKTKDQLADGLKKLMLSKPFEKITIKQICDETGVIRITFYNYFVDKYEALDYIIYRDVCVTTFPYIKEKNFEKAMLVLFYTIHQNSHFYQVLFNAVQVQEFEGYLMKNLEMMTQQILNNYPKKLELSDGLTMDMVKEFYSLILIYAIKNTSSSYLSAKQMLDTYRRLVEVASSLLTIDKG